MSVDKQSRQWFKGFGLYLIKKLGYVLVLSIASYGIHLSYGFKLNNVLMICGIVIMGLGCNSQFSSVLINNDYNVRMTQITNPIPKSVENKTKADSYRFFISSAIVGGTLLFIGYMLGEYIL